ncbi:hypothetical protein V498_02908 [Pseudogymnoascus sp. VKM F-4517 (FW-2822)]|nr:hypothetical protein V498_02908 [Pseudogymnoascus sp. VKM F-4517 (FW-2822)]
MGVETEPRTVETARPTLPAPWTFTRIRTLVLVVVGVFAFSQVLQFPRQQETPELSFSLHDSRTFASDMEADDNWDDIPSSRNITWRKCFSDFDCAKLDVPLDWLDPSDDARAIIAIIRLPATDLDDYRGPVFFNPGGPGGSGVAAMRDRGKHLQEIIGMNHDLISFDPRGVGVSTPEILCWPSEQSAKMWQLLDVGAVDAHPGVIYDAYARATARSGACARSMGGTLDPKGAAHGVLSYIGTTSVARDMLEILTQMGEEKLKYWGFSYGTMLGGTFAALWPDKVERMVNDGNVNYKEWMANNSTTFSSDSDKVMAGFYKYCHLAGLSGCAFYRSTPEAIEERLDALLERLRRQPIVAPLTLHIADLPEVINYSSVKQLVSASLYLPISMFPTLARILASLDKGDGAEFINYYSASQQPLSCDCPLSSPIVNPVFKESTPDAFGAVLCADGGETDDSIEAVEAYSKTLMNMSKASGSIDVITRMNCVGWRVRAKWRFAGPFQGNTSHPILFIGNVADNATPLRSAYLNAEGFTNASVLVSDSFGHTTLSTPSTCIAGHIREYFQTGVVPVNGTVCKPDIVPFQPLLGADAMRGLAQPKLTEAVWELAKKKRKRAMDEKNHVI